jgi:hypothetical protein
LYRPRPAATESVWTALKYHARNRYTESTFGEDDPKWSIRSSRYARSSLLGNDNNKILIADFLSSRNDLSQRPREIIQTTTSSDQSSNPVEPAAHTDHGVIRPRRVPCGMLFDPPGFIPVRFERCRSTSEVGRGRNGSRSRSGSGEGPTRLCVYRRSSGEQQVGTGADGGF